MKEELELTIEDYENAKVEVSFLVNMLSDTIFDVVGKSAGIVGTMAGREVAGKIPAFSELSDIPSVTEGIQNFLADGFDMNPTITEEYIELTIGECLMRDVCCIGNIPLGQNPCNLFHNYINGMMMELTGKKLETNILKTGDNCVVRHNLLK